MENLIEKKESKKEDKNKGRELAYYLTIFKLEGHTTWRANLAGHKNSFHDQVENPIGQAKPKITEKQTIRFDRITGTFSEA